MTIYDAISINEKILRIPWIVMELHGIDFIRTPPVLLLIGNEEALEKRKNLWGEIKTSNPKLYYKLKYASLSGWTDLPGAVGRRLTIGGYRLANAVYRFQ